ncbi:MAG: ATP-dependent Clp protease proteolytic subunit [Bacteroidota bacterium]
MENFSRLQDLIDYKILSDRKVFMWSMVDDNSAKHVIDRLMYLDMVDPGKEIQMIINSPGGYVTAGMAIHDTMKSISSPVSTICTGLAASMGSILLSAGEKGRRFCMPYGRVMIHQPSGGAQGTATDIEIQVHEMRKTKEIGARILAENCGHSLEKVMDDFNRDYWMDAEESVGYGIVDAVLTEMK